MKNEVPFFEWLSSLHQDHRARREITTLLNEYNELALMYKSMANENRELIVLVGDIKEQGMVTEDHKARLQKIIDPNGAEHEDQPAS